jgi:hypothetical protein
MASARHVKAARASLGLSCWARRRSDARPNLNDEWRKRTKANPCWLREELADSAHPWLESFAVAARG